MQNCMDLYKTLLLVYYKMLTLYICWPIYNIQGVEKL